MEIKTWGKLPFEFAHFSDRQLANALSEYRPSSASGRPGSSHQPDPYRTIEFVS